MTLLDIVEQLKACKFTCKAGMLIHNTAFHALQRRAFEELMMTPIPQNAKIYTLAEFNEKVKNGELEEEMNKSFGYYATSTHYSFKRPVLAHPIESWMTHVAWFTESRTNG